jgi:hypothetical protein
VTRKPPEEAVLAEKMRVFNEFNHVPIDINQPYTNDQGRSSQAVLTTLNEKRGGVSLADTEPRTDTSIVLTTL